MGPMTVPEHPCPACGAIVPAAEIPPGETTVETPCPNCGLAASTTVLSPAGPPLSPTEQRLAHRVHRRRQRERAKAELVGRYDFPIYGLADEGSERWVVGWGSSTRSRLNRVTLGHGEPVQPEGPSVSVETMADEHDLSSMARMLSQDLWHSPGGHNDHVQAVLVSDDPLRLWDSIAIDVDAVTQPFRRLQAGSSCAALGRLGTGLVSVMAIGVDVETIALTEVDDLEPYLSID